LEFPQKICGLRPDSLGFLLNYANINAFSRVLVVENTRGFLTGALLERCVPYILRVDISDNINDESTGPLKTHGTVKPNNQILKEFNINDENWHRIGYLNGSLLKAIDSQEDIIAHQLAKSQKHAFNSALIVHD